jgi:chlorobactene glucosyltransferase
MGHVFFWLILSALSVMGATLVTNLILYKRVKPDSIKDGPLVSVLIPARNEAENISATIASLLQQSYPAFEVLVLDDQSTDGTADVAIMAARGDQRFRALSGSPLPPGWLGKNWACRQLADEAQGDLLLFLDADTRLDPAGLAGLVALHARTQADLLSVWPTQETITPAERLVVPLMGFAILNYLPLLGVHFLPFSAFAAANGQCMLFERSSYEQIGGHESVRQVVIEDVALARLVKQHGGRLRLADGGGLVRCRMYRDWKSVQDGFSKNILAGHGNSIPFLILSACFHGMVFLAPWGWLLVGGGWAAGMLILIGLLLRAAAALATRQRGWDAAAMPLSVTLMTLIALRSIVLSRQGGAEWKGRKVAL